MVDYQRLFHTGVRVPDLEKAMDELGRGLGVTWAQVQEREQPVWTPAAGLTTVALRFVYSCEGPQHIELLEGAPGSMWHAGDAPGVHHVGVWADDVAAETEALVGAGYTLAAAGAPPESGYGAFTYLQPPGGMIIELVLGAIEPMFERWWAGGSLG